MAKTYLQTKLSGIAGQIIGFDASGNAEAQNFSGGFSPRILYYSDTTGLTITATKDSISVNAIYDSSKKVYIMILPSFGNWVVSAEGGSVTVWVHEVTDYSATQRLLSLYTWSEIKAISDAGTAASTFSVGDCKAIKLKGIMGTINLDTTLYCYILGFDHNWALEANDRAHGIDFGTFKTTVKDGKDVALVDNYYGNYHSYYGTKYFQMCHWGPADSGGNHGGWKACDMRYDILGSTNKEPSGYGTATASGRAGVDPDKDCPLKPVEGTLMSCLPSDLRVVMKPIMKYTDNIAGGSDTASNVTTSIDYLPLLAEKEIYGSRTLANSAEQNQQNQYTYFANGNSKVKFKYNDSNIPCFWWERSPLYNNSSAYCIADVTSTYQGAAYSRGVAPIFRV